AGHPGHRPHHALADLPRPRRGRELRGAQARAAAGDDAAHRLAAERPALLRDLARLLRPRPPRALRGPTGRHEGPPPRRPLRGGGRGQDTQPRAGRDRRPVPTEGRPAMTSAKVFKVENRLAKLARSAGGKTVEEAVTSAEQRIESVRDRCVAALALKAEQLATTAAG